MTHRTSSGQPYRLYDAQDDLLDAELQLASIMFICGLDGSQIDTITIDEIIDEIDNTFRLNTQEFVEGVTGAGADSLTGDFVAYPKTASRDVISKNAFMLKELARRKWRHRSLAKYQGES